MEARQKNTGKNSGLSVTTAREAKEQKKRNLRTSLDSSKRMTQNYHSRERELKNQEFAQ